MEGQLKKIILSEAGDYLEMGNVPEHCRARDCATKLNHMASSADLFPFPVCKHSCGDNLAGEFRFVKLSPTFNILLCNHCCLRITLPSTVVTYAHLINWLKTVKSIDQPLKTKKWLQKYNE